MRLLIATHARGPIGGIENYLRGVAPALRARGHDVGIIYEYRVEAMSPADGDPFAGCHEWDVNALGLEPALQAIRRWRPERIWTHGLHSAALEAALLAAGPAIVYAHNYDGTCATGGKYFHWPPAHACTRTMGVGCIAMNFTRHCGLLRPSAFGASFARQRQRQASLHRYRRILVASRHMAEEMRRALGAVRTPPVVIVGYPLLQAPAAALPERAGPPARLLMLARLTRAKGGAVLLDAMAQAQRTLGRRLSGVIAGEGPERGPLAAQAQRLGLDVQLPGWLNGEARQRALADCDVLAMPSLWPEPFGMSGIEAAAAGAPAVAFDVGGIRDWLTTSETGELAPGAHPTASGLAAALARLLGDTAYWQRLRRGSWQGCKRFALEPHLDHLERVLDV